MPMYTGSNGYEETFEEGLEREMKEDQEWIDNAFEVWDKERKNVIELSERGCDDVGEILTYAEELLDAARRIFESYGMEAEAESIREFFK